MTQWLCNTYSFPIATHNAPSYADPERIDTPRSGLLRLRNGVAAYFDQNQVPAIVANVGLKYRAFILNQNLQTNAGRVVFIPGDFDGDASPRPRRFGSITRHNNNAGSVYNPRELACWDRTFTISVWSPPVLGHDQQDQTMEQSEAILEQTVRAVQASAQATVFWGDVVCLEGSPESLFGVELLVHAIQRLPIFDATLDVVTPSAGAMNRNVK